MIETHKKKIGQFLGPTVDLLISLLEKGYTLNDIGMQTECDMGLLVALAHLLNKQKHAVKQYERSMDHKTLQIYGSYMDILDPLVNEKKLKTESMSHAGEHMKIAGEYEYLGDTQKFSGDSVNMDIHVELIISDLKCYREEIMNYLDTLFSMDMTPVRTEIMYCYDKLKYVERTLVFMETPKECGERRQIYNDLKRHRYEIHNKRIMSVLENSDGSMRLKADSDWLEALEISETMSPEDIGAVVDRLSRLAQMEAFKGDAVYIAECLEDMRLIDSVRRMQRDGEDDGLHSLELRWTLAKHRKTRLELKHENVQLFVTCLADMFALENPRLQALEQKLEVLGEKIERCEEEVRDRRAEHAEPNPMNIVDV